MDLGHIGRLGVGRAGTDCARCLAGSRERRGPDERGESTLALGMPWRSSQGAEEKRVRGNDREEGVGRQLGGREQRGTITVGVGKQRGHLDD
jgi:hypothetical protein